MPTYRPDIREDFSLEAWNRSPADIAARAAHLQPMDGWLMNNQPTHVMIPQIGEIRVTCPRCGSPYLAQFAAGEQRYSGEFLPGFTCTAGDCETAHPKMCSADLEDRAEAAKRCAKVHGPAGYARRTPTPGDVV